MINIKDIIFELQQALVAEGYSLKLIDGVMGIETYQTTIAYQQKGSRKSPVINKPDWRLARSLNTLRAQLNHAYPDRNKAEDGTIGDTAHQERTSDHNAWIKDPDGSTVVSALDITHDPVHGCDCSQLAKIVIFDARIKYVIWNRQIYNPSVAKKWRPYKGANPHDKHMHVSVLADKNHYDDESLWKLVKS